MTAPRTASRIDVLLVLMVAYCAASLLHFVHNAVFLAAYPNLPAWFTSGGVMGAWLGITALGAAGYGALRAGYRWPGFILIGIYGALGLDGLAHYTRAPIAAHSFAMNFTIGFEVLAATLVLIAVAMRMLRLLRGVRPISP